MKYFLSLLLSFAFIAPICAQPKKECGCKDCKCTKESHCGCMAQEDDHGKGLKCDDSGKCQASLEDDSSQSQ